MYQHLEDYDGALEKYQICLEIQNKIVENKDTIDTAITQSKIA
jgi:hypothetical protein